jgi:hypothetical protein
LKTDPIQVRTLFYLYFGYPCSFNA